MFVWVLHGETGLHGYQLLKAAPEHPLAIEGQRLEVEVWPLRILHDLRIHLVPVFAGFIGDPGKNHRPLRLSA